MAGRDLKAFSFYRIIKFLSGRGKQGLRKQPPTPAAELPEGPFHGSNESERFSNESSLKYMKISKETEQIGQMQVGADGGKKSDWLPEDLDFMASSEAGRLIKKLVTPISRRKKQGRKRKTLDMRRTIHQNMKHGGSLLKMRWQMRKPGKPRVVLILDTSSSMLPSAKMMLQFLYALQDELRSVEVFIFGNQINYVTPYLQRDFKTLLKEISALPQWDYGGTELWRPLAQLRDKYAHLFTSRTVVILLTDCMLYEKYFALAPLKKLRRRVKKLYLFNPDPRTRDLNDKYYQETIFNFKTVVDRMFYTQNIHEVATALRQIMG